MRAVAPLVLMLLVAACAPATMENRYSPAEGSRVFTLSVDRQNVRPARGAFSYQTQGLELDVVLNHVSFGIEFVNESNSTVRWDLGRSAIVLADGSRSPIVTGGTIWDTRDEPQPTVEIPPHSMASGVLLPRSLFRQDSGGGGLIVDPMFDWPLARPVTIRLLLAMEIGGREREIDLVFEGAPSE